MFLLQVFKKFKVKFIYLLFDDNFNSEPEARVTFRHDILFHACELCFSKDLQRYWNVRTVGM